MMLAPALAVCLLGASRDSEAWRFNIPAQNAVGGLNAFARQASTVQILMSQQAVRSKRTSAVRGDYTAEVGLSLLLRGSGLQWRRTGPSTYSIVTARNGNRRAPVSRDAPQPSHRSRSENQQR